MCFKSHELYVSLIVDLPFATSPSFNLKNGWEKKDASMRGFLMVALSVNRS